MPTVSRIVVATDFSAGAQKAVERAAHLAALHRRSLHLIHVFNGSAWANARRLLEDQLSSHAPLENAEHRLRALAKGILSCEADAEMRIGRAASQIVEVTRARHAGLIIIGEQGEGIQKELELGGTAIKVLRDAPCPVLVVKRSAERPYRVALVGTDFSNNAARAYRASVDCFPEASHIVVHAYSVPFEARLRTAGTSSDAVDKYADEEREQARSAMERFLARRESPALHTVAAHLKKGHPVPTLLEEIFGQGADLVVLGKHSGVALGERLLGSVTQTVLRLATCDVLLVP